MSRDWKNSEATPGADGTYSCLDTDVTVTQLIVAIDGLSVVTKKGGAADQCISSMERVIHGTTSMDIHRLVRRRPRKS